jgi:hypothetical protein
VRIRIIATRPVRKMTIMDELNMENQWIWRARRATESASACNLGTPPRRTAQHKRFLWVLD